MKLQKSTLLIIILLLSGCASVGPPSITADRFEYNAAITRSWKEQALLTIVKIRYLDVPVFVDVASIVSGYTLEGELAVGGQERTDESLGSFFKFDASGKYTDRPTITYKPLTGDEFNQSIMTPLPPRLVLFLVQAGWPVDLIFPMTVDSINGLRARVSAGLNERPSDPRFTRAIQLLRKIQKSGAVGMRIVTAEGEIDKSIMVFFKENIPKDTQDDIEELNKLLGLKPGIQEIGVGYGLIQKSDTEIVMLTRSLMHILVELAGQIDPPQDHVSKGFAVPVKYQPGDDDYLIRVKHSKEEPANAYAAVKYEDYWFYIDKGDRTSKNTFLFLMVLFSMTEKGDVKGLPLVTIPAG